MDMISKIKKIKDKGFTLVELLIVVGIIGVLAVLAVPSFSRVKNTALEAGAIKGLEAMYDAYEMYYRDHGYYPPARSTYTTEFFAYVKGYLPRDLKNLDVTDSYVKGYELQALTKPFDGAVMTGGLISGSHYFTIMAIPVDTGRGLRTFFIEPNGIVTSGHTENPI